MINGPVDLIRVSIDSNRFADKFYFSSTKEREKRRKLKTGRTKEKQGEERWQFFNFSTMCRVFPSFKFHRNTEFSPASLTKTFHSRGVDEDARCHPKLQSHYDPKEREEIFVELGATYRNKRSLRSFKINLALSLLSDREIGDRFARELHPIETGWLFHRRISTFHRESRVGTFAPDVRTRGKDFSKRESGSYCRFYASTCRVNSRYDIYLLESTITFSGLTRRFFQFKFYIK